MRAKGNVVDVVRFVVGDASANSLNLLVCSAVVDVVDYYKEETEQGVGKGR
jgi:hypothetical protein